ncbi:hypothetical protein [Streptomyces spirodelae]|uniref:Uncharacterized protein n=1 Tax=Streptomyces spirodelae TaxID=2812904 RepID=A0ABS3WLH8_9ACTN|nr:hypothetical protein [Streptomyces spirodelae]MBO8183972.1 hypothetical protein [Streptomyces spirodelae]
MVENDKAGLPLADGLPHSAQHGSGRLVGEGVQDRSQQVDVTVLGHGRGRGHGARVRGSEWVDSRRLQTRVRLGTLRGGERAEELRVRADELLATTRARVGPRLRGLMEDRLATVAPEARYHLG